MSNTRGMSRREKLQYEARIRNMLGVSKLRETTEAFKVLRDEGDIDSLMRKGKPAKWADGGAYSPEVMYGTDEENAADWANSGIFETANKTLNEEMYG